jgi:hypothetical protein
MRKEIKGAGMMAQQITWHGAEGLKSSLRDLASQYEAGKNSFDISVAGIEEWARRQLAGLGFKDGDENRFTGDSLDDRAGDYAVQVLRYIRFVRKAIMDNNAPEAARFSVSVGELFARIQATIEWEKFALRGKKLAESKRGLSRLYREARAVLEQKGAKLPPKLVRRELELRDVIRDKSDVLHWNDDQGIKHKTKAMQFASRLSKLRKLIR